jgi:GTP pyrophosphokinase
MIATTISTPISTPEITNSIIPDWLKECSLARANEGGDHSLVCRAFDFAHRLHEGQYRKSGEPYIAHPIAVSGLLRDLGADEAMIAAGFLHDVVEDTEITVEEIEQLFGTEVASLVEGVTKLSKYNFSNKTERQAENFRRMFLAMAKDIRVIVIKLADRLHNMRTLEYLKPDKQRAIALETKEIFAPLANRLGIWHFKWELEDLSFKYLESESYREIQELVAEKRIDRETRLDEVSRILRDRLDELDINVVELKGRPKHLYSIYQKMQRQQKEFGEIYDLAAMRIIVESKDECYRALAVVHDAFKPIPGRFKDYIGLPKANRYQSLHTTIVSLNGRPLEVQIRTREMHRIAEYGIAAHWKYKETGVSQPTKLTPIDEKVTWLRQLLEWQNDLKDAKEYVESLKENLFEDDVFVFTPKGDVIPLTFGSTPVDFAYHIHSEVGNKMKGAKVNGRLSVLDKPLHNGDIVEIITQKNGHPSLDWLNFVVTPTARNRIRQWFKRANRDENIARAKDLLEKELGKSGLESLLKSQQMQNIAEKFNYHKVEDLLSALGYGEVTLNQLVNRIREANKVPVINQQAELPITPVKTVTSPSSSKSPIVGVEGMLYYIAGCCQPLPGEAIIGVVTRGPRGISIHRQGCGNVDSIPGDRLIPVSWNPIDKSGRAQTYSIDLVIEAIDRVGILKDILARVSDRNINISNAGVKTGFGKPAIISLSVDICDRRQLEDIISQIKNMSDILNIRRVSQVDPVV